jgi:rare lipoprotein A
MQNAGQSAAAGASQNAASPTQIDPTVGRGETSPARARNTPSPRQSSQPEVSDLPGGNAARTPNIASPLATQSQNPIAENPPATPAVPAQNIKPSPVPAEIKGASIVAGRVYRIQVGSYKVPRNAVEAFDRLSAVGLSPSWEPFEGYYRIVITGIKAEDIQQISEKLAAAGFKEAIARIESYENE